MKKIKIAQIGTSLYSHGYWIWETLKKRSDLFEIAGYALPEKEEEKFPKRMPAFEGYPRLTVEEILADPTIEAVTIETEEIYLTKYALMAAKAGKHIHMEKPGSPDREAFKALIDEMKKSGKVLHLGYMYRYNPAIIRLVQRVKSGELGEINSVEVQMSGIFPQTDEARQWLATFPGGMTFFLGCHIIDLVLQIQGKPQEVLPLNCATGIGGTTSLDYGMAVFKYPNGVSFIKTNAAEVEGYQRRQLVVCGSKETVEIRPLEVSLGGSTITTGGSEPFDRYGGMMAAFAAYVRGEKENPYSLDYELDLFKTILKACGALK